MIEQPSVRRGRPAGQFLYHKLCLLKFLQEHQKKSGNYRGNNEALGSEIGMSPRQVARYVRALQDEKIPGTNTPRILVFYQRLSASSMRIITVSDMRPLNLF